jgi:selenide,water dikinase
VLVGHAGSDDAGVYRLSDDAGLVMTVDFFTPIVDDPYDYGRVAATNSLSDVYAMGGRPIAALNIAGFPEGEIAPEVASEILRGGLDAARAAGVAVMGGHTVNDKEVKFGLAVVGLIDPERIVTNAGAKPGDRLVLTKPLGTGVLSTALKAGKLDEAGTKRLVDTMTQLNREASQQMLAHGVHACTDVTGFGLLGHAAHMARESGVEIAISASQAPLMEGALQGVRDGHLTGGGGTNRMFVNEMLRIEDDVDDEMMSLLCDPQTAGGLLIALPAKEADALVAALRPSHPQAAVVGECREASKPGLVVSA